MIDPLVSLAFSMQSNKGVYALLLGSGVSRSAQIPTGWDIVLDLTRKLAILEGEDCEPDPDAWYKTKFGKYPDYSELLDAVAKSPAERNQLLKAYFEPNDEEREEGIKLPTAAHKAIAKMVARGCIRVIVTTNFDHLLEKALAEEGIEPTVISNADSVNGALPLVHTNCTIIKVNGDYLDTRIRNTREELASYEEEINKLLDRVFDEFGLIVCGWSGDWDIALRSALERCMNHRFTTYWTDIRTPADTAKKLLELRKGEFILIQNADSFFDELAEKVIILEEYNRPHPLSVKALIAQVKKYLVDERYEIRLHDLVNQENEKLYNELSDKEKFPVDGIPRDKFDDEFRRQVQLYESLTEPVLAMMITGCYWGKKSHGHLWVNCLERIANLPGEQAGKNVFLDLRLYPALLLLYAGGIASIAAGKYETFSTLINIPKVKHPRYLQNDIVLNNLHIYSVIESENDQRILLPDVKHSPAPLNDHIYNVLRTHFKELLPREDNYQEFFDRFEYLFALCNADLRKERGELSYVLTCRFCRRTRNFPETWINNKIKLEFENSIAQEPHDFPGLPSGVRKVSTWPPLKAGLFGGSIERFESIKQEFDESI